MMTITIRNPLFLYRFYNSQSKAPSLHFGKISHLGQMSLVGTICLANRNDNHLILRLNGPHYLVWKLTCRLLNFCPGSDGLSTPRSIEEQQHHLRIPSNMLSIVQLPLKEVKNWRPRGEKADRWLCWYYHIFCSTEKEQKHKQDCELLSSNNSFVWKENEVQHLAKSSFELSSQNTDLD